jgi:hypothetical protein
MSPMVGIALMLDPTKKGTYLKKMGWETEWIETAEENFALAYDQYAAAAKGNTGTTVIPQKRNIDEHDEFEMWEHSFNVEAEEDVPENEIESYLSSSNARHGTDISSYWKGNQNKYPILAEMARDFLSIQASSVSAERAFSSGGNLVTSKRCSMTGATIEMTQVLKYYFRENKGK